MMKVIRNIPITRQIVIMVFLASFATALITAIIADRHAVEEAMYASQNLLESETELAAKSVEKHMDMLAAGIKSSAGAIEKSNALFFAGFDTAGVTDTAGNLTEKLIGDASTVPTESIDILVKNAEPGEEPEIAISASGSGVLMAMYTNETEAQNFGSMPPQSVIVAFDNDIGLTIAENRHHASTGIALIDRAGKIVLSKGIFLPLQSSEIAELWKQTGNHSKIDATDGTPLLVASYPVDIAGDSYMVVAQEPTSLVLEQVSGLRRQQAIQGAITMLFIATFGLILARLAMRPLEDVSKSITQLCAGDLNTKIPGSTRNDEIGHIAAGVVELKEVWKNRDEMQRVANIREHALSDSSSALVVIDDESNIIEANQAFMDMMVQAPDGFQKNAREGQASDLAKQNVTNLLQDSNPLLQLLDAPANLPASADLIFAQNRIAVRASVLELEADNKPCILLEWQDVGKKRRNDGLVRAIDENSATIEFDMQGNVKRANATFKKLMGYNGNDIDSLTHAKLVPDHIRNSTEYKTFWSRLNSGEQISGKFQRIAKDGKAVWLQAAYNPIVGADGKPYRVIKYASDITDIENLAFDRKAILDAIGKAQSVIEINAEGCITSVNEVFCQSIGFSESELVSQPLRNFMHKDYVEGSEYREMWEKLSTGSFDARVYQFAAPDGSKHYYQGASTPVFDRKGSIEKFICLIADVTDSETERLAQQKKSAEMTKHQTKIVEHMRRGLTALADGDLSVKLDEEFGADYEQLRHDFNRATERLRETVAVVISNSDGIRNEASEISRAADDLSRRTENQAATLEETSAALEELTASVKSAAEGAEKASRNVTEAKTNAEQSGGVVDEAISAMSAIESSSRQISQIIGVIDDIAFQTNLLALNAGVEAARAGDAGRGFAVVASEVRALAQRSSEAAKEIKDLISTSSEQVGSGVELVGRTGQALREILSSVTSIADLVSDIANTAKEQSVGIGEINTAVNQIDQVTQQNAAMVEESTAASHSMMQEAEQLAKLISQFKIGAKPPAIPVTHAPKPSAPAMAAPRAATPPPPKPTPQAPLKQSAVISTEGNTALKVEEDDDWQEF